MECRSLPHMDEKLDAVYQRNVDMVYRLCYVYLKNPSDTDDALQSVFLKFMESNPVFRDMQHERAWFIVATKNHCKNILKSWWKSHRVDMEALPEITYWDQNEQQSKLLEKLLLLPEKYKIPLYLYYYEEYSIKEISQILGRKESTIQSQLARGRERLKYGLGGENCEK